MSVIYVIEKIAERSPARLGGVRTLLAYTTENRAKMAMKSRGLRPGEYMVVEYVPKERRA